MATRIVDPRAARNETKERVTIAAIVFFDGVQPGGSVNIGIGDGISESFTFLSSLRSVSSGLKPPYSDPHILTGDSTILLDPLSTLREITTVFRGM
jgi:hypothetical protein